MVMEDVYCVSSSYTWTFEVVRL